MAHDAEQPPALTDAEAAERIHARFPSLATARVVRLGEGTDHQAFEVEGRYVFRFPKSDEAAEHLKWEARLLAWLEPRLPLPVPNYRFLAHPAADLAAGFAGYEKLPGTPALLVEPDRLDLSDLGRRLGAFLGALHALDPTEADALGVPADDDPELEAWSAAAVDDLCGSPSNTAMWNRTGRRTGSNGSGCVPRRDVARPGWSTATSPRSMSWSMPMVFPRGSSTGAMRASQTPRGISPDCSTGAERPC